MHDVSASSLTMVSFQTEANSFSFDTGSSAWATSTFSTAEAFGVRRTSAAPAQSRPLPTSNR